jgi:fatty-acyl-CoA synthase
MARRDATIRPFFWRATRLFPEKEVVARTHDGIERYTYSDFGERARALATGLEELGVGAGDRVGTLAWNHHRHL